MKTFKDYFVEMLQDPATGKIAESKVLALLFSLVEVIIIGVILHMGYKELFGDNNPTNTGDLEVLKEMVVVAAGNALFILVLAMVIKFSEILNLKNVLLSGGNNPQVNTP